MTTHKMTTTEETHLLEREDEARGGFSRRQIASAGASALAIGGVAVAGSRGQFIFPHVFFEAPRGEEGEARRAGGGDDDSFRSVRVAAE